MKKILKVLCQFILGVVCVCLFIGVCALAYLQESYRLNPPTQAERAEHPVLIRFLAGGEE